jgi:cell fate (sporulation/competence/biofilm development) regulator YmcA (YheA/YmcA/DUF963 family)
MKLTILFILTKQAESEIEVKKSFLNQIPAIIEYLRKFEDTYDLIKEIT